MQLTRNSVTITRNESEAVHFIAKGWAEVEKKEPKPKKKQKKDE